MGVFTAALANLLIFDMGVGVYEVVLPTDDMNEGAALSKSYLLFALRAGLLFQLWHVFSTEMFARYILLAVTIVLHGPWAERFLPAKHLKHYFWAPATETREPELIEMAHLAQVDGH